MQKTAAQLLGERQFLTGAGTETYLLFQQEFPLREFCAFELLDHDAALAEFERRYLFPLMSTVDAHGHGLLLDALLWRAHPDFVAALGYAPGDVRRLNQLGVTRTRAAVESWRARESRSAEAFPVLVVADIGPRGDGYNIGSGAPSVESARRYHRAQIDALTGADFDVLCAWTMTSANEAIGIATAAAELERPMIVSPTVETDGRLPDGTTLADFIRRVDDATDALPLFYMVNCAHPTHVESTLEAAESSGADWLERFRGFRANCSRKSHEELDNSTELDRGDPRELAVELAAMQRRHGLRVIGGCCGTDVEHITEMARATA